jgi:hypothetical protein
MLLFPYGYPTTLVAGTEPTGVGISQGNDNIGTGVQPNSVSATPAQNAVNVANAYATGSPTLIAAVKSPSTAVV